MIRVIMSMLLVMGPSAGWGQSISIPVDDLKQDGTPATAEGEKTEEQKAQEAVEKKKVERVEVTGSRIKRIDTEGVSPIQTITRKDLDKSGQNSVSDVLRNSTVSTFGGARETSGGASAGSASVSLRGLGADKTLVLLDGQRLPTDAVTGTVDLNLIPMAAIERVEVLKEGASAVYGSDALGGVVNMITRKDFNGSEVSIAQTAPEMRGGRKREISLVNGFSTRKLNMVNVVQYRNNERIFDRDRSWSNNMYSDLGKPGTYFSSDSGLAMADPACPPERIETDSDGNQVCKFRFSDYSTELPDLEQTSLLNNTNYELSSRVRLNARIGASQRKVKWTYAPAPEIFSPGDGSGIPYDVASGWGPGGTPPPGLVPGEDVTLYYRTAELGTRDTENVSNSYNASLGSTIDVGGGWEVGVTGSTARVVTKDRGVNGYAVKSAFRNKIITGQVNPLYGGSGDISDTRYIPEELMTSQVSTGEVRGSGAIAELPSGPMSLAVGSQFIFQKYKDQFDDLSVAGDVIGNAGSSGGGQRDVRALYAELAVPLTSKLELSLADRYDHYSDFGDATSPRAGLLYKATKQLMFRGSVGTGFKAPNMQDLYAATSDGNPTFIDHVKCAQSGGSWCNPRQYSVTSGGNPGLEEERSLSYNAGVVYEPTRDFNIGVDYYLVKLRNVVGIDYEDITKAQLANIDPAQYNVIVTRDAQGRIENIKAPLQNLSAQQTEGVDVTAGYTYRRFHLATQQTTVLNYKQEGFPGTGFRNKLGENGLPKWRNNTALTYNPADRHSITASAMTIAGQQKERLGRGDLADYTTADLQYSYESKSIGTFTVGVNNVFDTKPPLDDTRPTEPLDVTLYDSSLRTYYTGYKATF